MSLTSTDSPQETLDRIARAYSEDSGFESVLNRYKIQELSRFCRGKTMLDIGCGVGFVAKALSVHFEAVTGIDGSRTKIEKALSRNTAPNIEYICTLFEEFRPRQPYDFAVSCNVLEHVSDSVGFLKQVRSWLSPQGKVAMTVPNAKGLHKRLGKAMGLIQDFYELTAADRSKGHHRVYDRERLETDFKAAGFAVEYLSGILLKPLSHAQMESWDLKTVDALYEIGKELPDYCSSLVIVAGKG